MIRFIPYLLLLVFSFLMKTSGITRVIADLVMLLIPLVYIWKRQKLEVFNVSGYLLIPIYLSIWSVNTGVFFIVHDYPGRDVAKVGAMCFLIAALIAISFTKDLGKLNGMKKETLSLNLFLYFMLGLGTISKL